MNTSRFDAHSSKFSASDFRRVIADTFVGEVNYYDELPSTNTCALELADKLPGDSPSPLLILANKQTAGRGRGSNVWWSDDGSLTFSLLFRSDKLHLPPNRWPQLSLATGLAVCDAIELLIPGAKPLIKWPNDVLIDGRKVSGILVEASDGQRGNLILGIGVNVRNTFQGAPPDLRAGVVALSELTAAPIDRAGMLIAVLQCLESRLNWLAFDNKSLKNEWSRRCVLTGKHVEISIHSRRILGLCEGIDHDGALILNSPAGQERCFSGTIIKYD